MRNAALVLGIIGGIVGMIVGSAVFGYTELIARWGEWQGVAEQVDHVTRSRGIGLLAPILAIGGGAMARARPNIAGAMLVVSSIGMYWGFGFNFATMFPIAMAGLAGLLALGARQPDAH